MKVVDAKHCRCSICSSEVDTLHPVGVWMALPTCRGRNALVTLQAEGITSNCRDAVSDNFLCTGEQIPFRHHVACAGLYPQKWNRAMVHHLTLTGCFVRWPRWRRFQELQTSNRWTYDLFRYRQKWAHREDVYMFCGVFCHRLHWSAGVKGTSLCCRGGLVESDQNSRDFHMNLFGVVPFLKSVLGKDTQHE